MAQRRRFLPSEEVSVFCEQVALVLGSGIALYDGIDALCDNYKNTRYGARFARINETVKENGSLYDAVREVGVFPPYMVNMVRVGEAAGKLEEVMNALALYYERDAKIAAAVRNAVLYPVALVAMMAVVVGVLVARVLPVFDRVFRNLGSDMTSSVATVMNVGMVIGRVVLAAVALAMLLVIVVVVLAKLGRGRRLLEWLGNIFPPVRHVMQKTAAGRFASVLSMMLTAGYPIAEAIRLTPGVLSDGASRERAEKCGMLLEEGAELPRAIAEAGLFAPIHNKMVQVGFMAGQTDRVMRRLADIYEEEIDEGIRRLVALIEPTLVALLAIAIGGILLAVMLPLAGIMSSIV